MVNITFFTESLRTKFDCGITGRCIASSASDAVRYRLSTATKWCVHWPRVLNNFSLRLIANTPLILRDVGLPPRCLVIPSLFWDVTQRELLVIYRRFEKTYPSYLQERRSPWPFEGGANRFVSRTSVNKYQSTCVTSQKSKYIISHVLDCILNVS